MANLMEDLFRPFIIEYNMGKKDAVLLDLYVRHFIDENSATKAEDIMKDTGMPNSTVYKAIEELSSEGSVKSKGYGFTGNAVSKSIKYHISQKGLEKGEKILNFGSNFKKLLDGIVELKKKYNVDLTQD